MADGRKNNGGHSTRGFAGRKPKADEKKANTIFVNALKEIYSKETSDEAKTAFVKETLLESQRGQLFVAEHIFGKAPQEVKNTNYNLNQELTPKEAKELNKLLENEY